MVELITDFIIHVLAPPPKVYPLFQQVLSNQAARRLLRIEYLYKSE